MIGTAMATISASRPAEGDGEQHDDGDDGDEQVLHQLVDLVVGRLAVVAGDVHVDVVGDDRCRAARRRSSITSSATRTALVPLRLATAMVTAGRSSPAAGAAPARRSRRAVGRRRAEADAGVALHLLRPVDDAGHVAQVHRPPVGAGDQRRADLVRPSRRTGPASSAMSRAAALEASGLHVEVGGLERPHHLEQRDAARRQARRVGVHRHLARARRRPPSACRCWRTRPSLSSTSSATRRSAAPS